ncbi:MAG TPA: FmdB family zinc ribbon protein [Nitrospiraceae bacterium]|nr:FmdB family zinc ribbon protein [Nitrospiraceae bacterium]
MPIYEYLCEICAHRFEVKQSIKEDPITSCIRCGREVRKLISSPAIMFKGSGWYVTDYSDKLKPAGGAEGAEKPAEKPTDGKGAQPTPASGGNPAPAAPAASKEAAAPTGSTPASGTAPPTPAASSS